MLSKDNRIVHGMWVGAPLGKLELLTLHSFVDHGHEFHLWVYDDVEGVLPDGVVIQDANEIIPLDQVFRKKDADPETGVGKGSFGSPFSDLFRYKLLYEKGGYWADMDVTCLRPLDFSEEYVFRPHRVGVVGNLMKCPKRSTLMRKTYQDVLDLADEDSAWLMANRVLSENVEKLDLTRFIQPNIVNDDSWFHAVRPLAEGYPSIPDSWYAIHWINEFWRTLKNDDGVYRGAVVMNKPPDRENPTPGSMLAELYRKYGLDAGLAETVRRRHAPPSRSLSHRPAVSASRPAPIEIPMPVTKAVDRQPGAPSIRSSRHVNILISSLNRGGAERIVLDILQSLQESGDSADLYVLYGTTHTYRPPSGDRIKVHDLSQVDAGRKLRKVALRVLANSGVVYTHLVHAKDLAFFWNMGVQTVPVIHNSQPSWQDAPGAFDHPNVPFLVAVSETVASQLREARCPKPVVTIRHELQRWFSPEELRSNRDLIRARHGIGFDTLLIGMVGQFKAQKAYTRAVRVLHGVQQICPAKLMILGGWDTDYGSGRQTYTATCRQALDLGILPDLIMPGSVDPVEPYYAAFDVFLNTSIYEGLSVSLLEAIRSGCPVVTADAGGNREVLTDDTCLVEDSSDIDAYIDGIKRLVRRSSRVVPQRPEDANLVPKLWSFMADHGVASIQDRTHYRTGTLFVTENLNFGGPQRSLVNLLAHLPGDYKTMLCVTDRVYAHDYLDGLERAQVTTRTLSQLSGPIDKAGYIVDWADRMRVRNICLWNVDPRIKLMIAKILGVRPIRLIDVSPGPMYFDEMVESTAYGRRVCLTEEQFYRRIDCFVGKYEGGRLPEGLAAPEKSVVIPNGVPTAPRFVRIPKDEVRLPATFDPNLAIGTCCRIAPSKRIEYLIDMMETLTDKLPGVSLTVAGAVDPKHAEYWETIVERVGRYGLTNVRFVGAHGDVRPFLQQFKVFVMVSDDQGCPNASLEAMSMGLPIVANADGGTAEQVQHGVNGYLVDVDDPVDMARRVEHLLRKPAIRAKFGQASADIARRKFSMESMVEGYMRVFCEGEPK